MATRSDRLIFLGNRGYGPLVETMISPIMSHTSMVSYEGSYTSGDFLGSWVLGFLHSSLCLYHSDSFSILCIIIALMMFKLKFIIYTFSIRSFIILHRLSFLYGKCYSFFGLVAFVSNKTYYKP